MEPSEDRRPCSSRAWESRAKTEVEEAVVEVARLVDLGSCDKKKRKGVRSKNNQRILSGILPCEVYTRNIEK